MRRIRLPLGRRTFLAVATLAALFATVPLRLVAGALGIANLGVSARAVEGSMWSGRLVEARAAGLPLGDLHAALRPLPLIGARARIDLAGGSTTDTAESGRAGLVITRHSVALVDASLRLPVARALAPLPVREIVLSDVTARFRDGLCEAAEGTVRAELADSGGIGLPGGFTGPPRCEGGALLLSLASPGGERLTLRLPGSGRYHAEVALRPGDPATAARLSAAGFVPATDGSLTLAVDGRW